MSSKIAPCACLAASAAIVGSSVVAGKLAAAQLPIFLSQAVSLTFALGIFIPLVWRKERRIPLLRGKELLLQIGQAFLGMFLFRVLLLAGLRTASAIEAGMITSTSPAVVALLSWMMLRESFTRRKVLGVLCSFLGVAVLQAPFANGAGLEMTEKTAKPLFGLLLIFLAVLGESMLTVLRKKTSESVSPLLGSAYVTFFAWLMFLPMAFWDMQTHNLGSFRAGDWGLMAYYGLIVTAAGYLLWFLGVAKVSGGTAAVFSGCIPVSTLLLSNLVLGETLRPVHGLGILLVVIGIGLHSFHRQPSALRTTAPTTESLKSG